MKPPPIPTQETTSPNLVPPQNPLVSPCALTPSGELGAYSPNADERTHAMLIHLLALLTGFIGPLILWLVKKDTSRFVDFHGKEAINFMISIFIYTIAIMLLGFLLIFVTAGFGMILVVPVWLVFSIGSLVLEILACVAAHRGDWHRYPMCIRFLS